MALKIRFSVYLIMLGARLGGSGVGFFCVRLLNYFYNEILLGIEIETGTVVGKGLKIYHGYGIVVNKNAVIGRNCTLRNGVVIGNKVLDDGHESACPVIGDSVDFGAGSIVIGPVVIGDNVKIGAGAVVVKDVPAGAVVVGNPAKIIRVVNI